MKLEGNSGKEGNGREGKGQNQRDRRGQSILYACMNFSNNKTKTFKWWHEDGNGWRGGVDLTVTGEKHGIKYDKNTLHGILKGLIKILKKLSVLKV